jgi:drug/metabolite transporter (DMT)-like permease
MGATAWVLLLALSVLWGGSFFFFKVLVAVLPPLTVALGRVALAALAMTAWLLLRRDPMPGSARLWGQFALMGLLNNAIPFALIAYGETRIASGVASILNATTPIFTVIAAHLLTRDEKLTPARAAAVLLGFVGVVVLTGAGLDLARLEGEGACLAAALSYALAGIYGRRFRGIPPLKVATGQVTASAFLLAPAAAFADQPWTLPMPPLSVWAAWAGIALICTALAYVLYFRILAMAGATNLLLVTFLLPISALFLGAVLLGEPVTGHAVLGMALIGLGLAAMDGRPLAMIRHRIAAVFAPPA